MHAYAYFHHFSALFCLQKVFFCKFRKKIFLFFPFFQQPIPISRHVVVFSLISSPRRSFWCIQKCILTHLNFRCICTFWCSNAPPMVQIRLLDPFLVIYMPRGSFWTPFWPLLSDSNLGWYWLTSHLQYLITVHFLKKVCSFSESPWSN